MKIAIDMMSGDLGSQVIVESVLKFHQTYPDIQLNVYGKKEELEKLMNIDNIEIVDARDVVLMTDSVLSVRRKKESSLVKALLSTKEETDGVISCASTGAYYTAAMLFLKRLENVEKSCLMAQVPTLSGKQVALLDVGANANTTANQLLEFALMGHSFVQKVKHIEKPKVALLNIGTEDHKGDDMHKEAYHLLSEDQTIHFVGNIEGRDLLTGDVDVIVTDGFSGNIALKTAEGAGMMMMQALKEALMSNTKGKLATLLAKENLSAMKNKFDYKSVGGALMVGFQTPIVKAHGSSDATAFYSALTLLKEMIEEKVVDAMKEGLEK